MYAIAPQFGENLIAARERAGISQEELGFRADLHRTEIGMLERGVRIARIDTGRQARRRPLDRAWRSARRDGVDAGRSAAGEVPSHQSVAKSKSTTKKPASHPEAQAKTKP